MSTFVLIHGAWHGAWCWKHVRKTLAAQGHEVFAPTLTGLADRVHTLNPSVSWSTHLTDILNLFQWEQLDDVVLVGHSYGGALIRMVADRIPQKIRSLVFVDAFVPDNGRSLNSYATEFAEQFRTLARDHGDGWKIPPVPPEVFNVNPADHALYHANVTPHPLASFEDPFEVAHPTISVAKIAYVYASDFPGSPFTDFRQTAVAKGWCVLDLKGGHDLMLDQPEALTQILLEAI
jgi:pimeloyl-ACP methyl ester carboxylesterase